MSRQLNVFTVGLRAGKDVENVKRSDDGKASFATVYAFHNPRSKNDDEDLSWSITIKFGKKYAGLADKVIKKGREFVVTGELEFSPPGETADGKKYGSSAFMWAQQLQFGAEPRNSSDA